MVLTPSKDDLYKSVSTNDHEKKKEHTKQVKIKHEVPRFHGDENQMCKDRGHAEYIDAKKSDRHTYLRRDHPSSLGLGTFTWCPTPNQTKPIVRERWPQQRKEFLREMYAAKEAEKVAKDNEEREETADEMLDRHRFASTKALQEKGNFIPPPAPREVDGTLEIRPDMIRYRPDPYEPTISEWQKQFREWDRLQMRNMCHRPWRYEDYADQFMLGRSAVEAYLSRKHDEFLDKFWKTRRASLDEITRNTQGFMMSTQCRVPMIPNYAGFVPRDPVGCTFDSAHQDIYRSHEHRTYRAFPLDVMRQEPRNAADRRTPFGRMVTCVYPSNPFKREPGARTAMTNVKQLAYKL